MYGKLLNHMKTFAHTHHIPIISPATEKFLREYINSRPIQHAREIGSAIGYSTMVIGKEIAQYN